ncbi:glycerophosphodiester phosphodiesterase family protein [Microbacterium koreense]|uniref:Glycerophosphodiester phosphodiesterase family protein n=1 Tax=Microbacterium koreense TaxID=323761 RepID=A0ABW2ZTQ3_9MICO
MTADRHPFFSAAAPRVLAHRGLVSEPDASDGIAENTVAAVAAAQAIGIDIVESDCHLTSDGHVVLFHDDDLVRVADDPRRVDAVSLAELESLMADKGGLLTLAQALETFPTLRFNLDVKSEQVADPLGRLIAPAADRVLVASFSDARRRRALAAAHDAGATLRPATSAGTTTITKVLAAIAIGARSLAQRALRGIDALQVPERQRGIPIVTPRLLSMAHSVGVEVHVWTINDPSDMRRLVDAGVDGIVTDRGDLAVELFPRGR